MASKSGSSITFSGLRLQNLHETFEDRENGLIFEKNVDIPGIDELPIRANVYVPLGATENAKYPVLVTYGPYGKDIHLSHFNPTSWKETNPKHKTKYSAWETPEPVYWTGLGYAIVRADERGTGQSPGRINLFSHETYESFEKVIAWAATQPWSSGKVGTLGISYYAIGQWGVAARRPPHLAAIVPWEGYTDSYRDNSRHGGIKSSSFLSLWWNRQIAPNQYGKPGRAAANWGEDTLEGSLTEEQLKANLVLEGPSSPHHYDTRFADDPGFSSSLPAVENIEVPILSVGNWGGNALHLRGNFEGYAWAGSSTKYLRLITGRHDLPFYQDQQVEVQRSFLDAFLKGDDSVGWSVPGKVPPVCLAIRKGDVGFNDVEGDAKLEYRSESSWPIERTQYTKYFLSSDGALEATAPSQPGNDISWDARGSLDEQSLVQFTSAPFERATEITGHIVAHLNMSLSPEIPSEQNDFDVFVTIRHISAEGTEIFYTGTVGDPTPVQKGWLRASMRKVDERHPKHRSYLPYRSYLERDVQPVVADQIYPLDVEIWPTCVVVEAGAKLVVEISSGDTQGVGIFQHDNKKDRPKVKFAGLNSLHFSGGQQNYVTLPIVPAKQP